MLYIKMSLGYRVLTEQVEKLEILTKNLLTKLVQADILALKGVFILSAYQRKVVFTQILKGK